MVNYIHKPTHEIPPLMLIHRLVDGSGNKIREKALGKIPL